MRVNRAWLGLVVLMLPTFLVAMDVTALLLALPQLSADLGATDVQQLWISDSYGLMVAWPGHHDRHARRPDRPPTAADDRLRGLRGAVGRGRLRGRPADADRRPGAAGCRRGDPGALHPRPDHQHVPRRTAARAGHRGLGDLPVHRRRARPRTRRIPPPALLVGLGVPDRRAGHGGGAARRAGPAAGVPQRPGRAAGPGRASGSRSWRCSCWSTGSSGWPSRAWAPGVCPSCRWWRWSSARPSACCSYAGNCGWRHRCWTSGCCAAARSRPCSSRWSSPAWPWPVRGCW